MKTKITDELLQLFEEKLLGMGYATKERPEHEKYGSLKDIHKGDDWVATITSNGLGFPQEPKLENEQSELADFFNRLREMYYLHKDGEPLPFNSITDYRVVLTFNDALLAVKLNKDNDFCFTTWDYDNDRKGVCYGHYFETNYEGARQDFLYRSGLVEQRKELKQDELAIIYDSLVYRGVNDNDITFDDEQLLKKITDKIAEDLPSQITEPREQEREVER